MLILTADAALAVRLTEPEQHVPKTYHVTVSGRPAPAVLAQLRRGVELPGGPTRPARVRLLEASAKGSVLEMILMEGRNRQIRRMAAALGHRVRRLVRVAIGSYTLGDLPPGAHWPLDAAERGTVTPLRARPRIISVSRDAQRSALPSRSAARRG